MDQIMWMLNLIPDAWLTLAIHGITLAGLVAVLAGSFLTHIPFIGNYARLVKTLGTILFVVGVYFEGGLSNEHAWRQRVAELEDKVKKAEAKSEKVNEKIQTRIVERTKVIREKGRVQIEYINRLVEGKTVEIVKDMSEAERAEFLAKQKELQDAVKNCPVPRIIVEEHNRAAETK